MAPKIIPVKPGEQIDTLIKLLKKAEEQEIIFLDEDKRLLLKENNLRLLSYFLQEVNKKAVVISESPDVRILCRRNGIPAYEDMGHLPGEKIPAAAAREVRPVTAPGRPGKVRIWLWAMGLCALFFALVFILFLLTPQATIIVYPQMKPLNREFSILAGINGVRRNNREVPARLLQKGVEMEAIYPTTGHKFIGIREAEGVVLFINSGPQPIIVPKGTVVATGSGVKFATQKEVVVPKMAAEKFFEITTGVVAGRAEVDIKALEKGAAGNVKEGRIVKISGKFSANLKVVNPESTRHGEDRLVRVVDARDVEEAKTALAREIPDKAEEELSALATAEYIFLNGLITVANQAENYTPGIGEEGNELRMRLTFTASTLVVSRADLAKALYPGIIRSIPGDFNLADGKVTILDDVVANPGPRIGTARLLVKTRCKIVGRINSAQLREKLAGLSIREARLRLTEMEEIGGFEIHPGNKGAVLPKWPFQLKIMVQNPA
ncbi:MAG: baseplate J/gp47 family protein [Bacillota bacterium]